MLCACSDSTIAYIALGDVDPENATPEPNTLLTAGCIALVYGAMALAFVVGQ
jgi:hypothetical protein